MVRKNGEDDEMEDEDEDYDGEALLDYAYTFESPQASMCCHGPGTDF